MPEFSLRPSEPRRLFTLHCSTPLFNLTAADDARGVNPVSVAVHLGVKDWAGTAFQAALPAACPSALVATNWAADAPGPVLESFDTSGASLRSSCREARR